MGLGVRIFLLLSLVWTDARSAAQLVPVVEEVQRWMPRWVERPIVPPAPFLAPAFIYGGAVLYLGWGAYEFKQHLIPKDQSPLTEATPAQRDAWKQARDMAKSRPQGFAVPHAVTSDELLEYFTKIRRPSTAPLFQPVSTVRNSAGEGSAKSPKKYLPDDIEELLKELKARGHRFQISAAKAEKASEDLAILGSMIDTICEYKDLVSRAMESRERYATQLFGTPDWNYFEELDRTFLYFIGLAADQFAWTYDYDGFRRTIFTLGGIIKTYDGLSGHMTLDLSPEHADVKRVREIYALLGHQLVAVFKKAQFYEARQFYSGSIVKKSIEVIVRDLRRWGGVPRTTKIETRVGEFNHDERPDLHTLRTVLFHLWWNVLRPGHADQIVIDIRPDSPKTTRVTIHAWLDADIDLGRRWFETRTAWLRSRRFDLGASKLDLAIDPAGGEPKTSLSLKFGLKNQWAFGSPREFDE